MLRVVPSSATGNHLNALSRGGVTARLASFEDVLHHLTLMGVL